MGSLKEIDPQFLPEEGDNRYQVGESGVIIYLESEDDVFIFRDKWFRKSRFPIVFKAASPNSGDKGSGGCMQVRKKVGQYGDVYGVVDRDALWSDQGHREGLWWETDDECFFAEKPFGENIFVLNRWEIENYLLHPEALRKLLWDKTRGTTPHTDTEKIAELLCAHEADFVKFSAHTIGDGEENRQEIEDKISSFSEKQEHPVQRWERLSRMLNGKKVIEMLGGRLDGKKKYPLQHEFGALAGHVAELGHKKAGLSELYDWLSEISE